MRARLAVFSAGIQVELREILLRDKPDAFLRASPKGTVPVVELADGRLLEESRDVMQWALSQNDPEGWLDVQHHDPDHTAPYSGEYPWPRTEARNYEYACHEGNYAMGNILRGARQLEREWRQANEGG